MKAEALNSYVSSSSQELSWESGAEDDLLAGPMDIDDSSFGHHMARSKQARTGPGADQDMNEVAEILLKMNVNLNGNKQRRWAKTAVCPFASCSVQVSQHGSTESCYVHCAMIFQLDLSCLTLRRGPCRLLLVHVSMPVSHTHLYTCPGIPSMAKVYSSNGQSPDLHHAHEHAPCAADYLCVHSRACVCACGYQSCHALGPPFTDAIVKNVLSSSEFTFWQGA